MSTPPEHMWQRLADKMIARRTELGFRQRKDFAEHCGLKSVRPIDDFENVRRTNYKKKTLARAEEWYQWAPGSIETVLDGGDPSPLEPRPGARYLHEFSHEELLVELGRRIAAKDPRLAHLADGAAVTEALHPDTEPDPQG